MIKECEGIRGIFPEWLGKRRGSELLGGDAAAPTKRRVIICWPRSPTGAGWGEKGAPGRVLLVWIAPKKGLSIGEETR